MIVADPIQNLRNEISPRADRGQFLVISKGGTNWASVGLLERVWRTVLSFLFCGFINSVKTYCELRSQAALSGNGAHQILRPEQGTALERAAQPKPKNSVGSKRGENGEKDIPYYQAVVKFKNSSNENCYYNSSAIVIAYAFGSLADAIVDQAAEKKKLTPEEHQERLMTLKKSDRGIPCWKEQLSRDEECLKIYSDETTRGSIESSIASMKKNITEKESQIEKEYWEEVNQALAAPEILKLLRSGTPGTLSEAQARTLSQIADTLLIDHPSFRWEPRHEQGSLLDPKALDNVLRNSDWRVIRVGGNRHWYCLVRQEDGRIVEINDDRRSSYWKLEQIYTHWTKQGEWRHSQICFYGPNVGTFPIGAPPFSRAV